MDKRQVNFRASDETSRQLAELGQWWGENLTAVVVRAVEQAHRVEEHRRDLVADVSAPDTRYGAE